MGSAARAHLSWSSLFLRFFSLGLIGAGPLPGRRVVENKHSTDIRTRLTLSVVRAHTDARRRERFNVASV
jgi:hypothetical protein